MVVFHKSEMGPVREKAILISSEVLKGTTWKIGCSHVELKDDEVPCPGRECFPAFSIGVAGDASHFQGQESPKNPENDSLRKKSAWSSTSP